MENDALDCLRILVRNGYGDILDWIYELCRLKIISKGDRQSLRNKLQNGDTEQVLLETCVVALHQGKLPDDFSSQDFEVDAKFADLIGVLLRSKELDSSIAWMVKSWDEMKNSDAIRHEAAQCIGTGANLDEENWVLNFIHHMSFNVNSSLQETFVEKAKKLLKSGITAELLSDDDDGPPDSMEVDEGTGSADEAGMPEIESFGNLNSDGENEKSPNLPASPVNDQSTLISGGWEMIPSQHGASGSIPNWDEDQNTADVERPTNIYPDRKLDICTPSQFSSIDSTVNLYTPDTCDAGDPLANQLEMMSLDSSRQSPHYGEEESKGSASPQQSSKDNEEPGEVLQRPLKPKPAPRKRILPAQDSTSLPPMFPDSEHRDRMSRFTQESYQKFSSMTGQETTLTENPNMRRPETLKIRTPIEAHNTEQTSHTRPPATKEPPVGSEYKAGLHIQTTPVIDNKGNQAHIGMGMPTLQASKEPHRIGMEDSRPLSQHSQSPATKQKASAESRTSPAKDKSDKQQVQPKPRSPHHTNSAGNNQSVEATPRTTSSKSGKPEVRPLPRQKLSVRSSNEQSRDAGTYHDITRSGKSAVRPKTCDASDGSKTSGSYSGKPAVRPKTRDVSDQSKTSVSYSDTVRKGHELKVSANVNDDRKSTLNSEQQDSGEVFFDAQSEPSIVTLPKSDDSFEIRAVFTAYDPQTIKLYISENCWTNWEFMELTYDWDRKLYCISLPRKEPEYKFQYKYHLRIYGIGDYWEYLPSGHTAYVNRVASVKRETRFFHDVPVFHRQSVPEVIANSAHLHLPTPKTYEGNAVVMQKQEIESCFAQFKRGWNTTAERYHIAISDKDMEHIAIIWISKLAQNARSQKEIVMKILAVLHFSHSIYIQKHKFDRLVMINCICFGLNMDALDTTNIMCLRRLLEQYYLNADSISLADMFIHLYRKVNTRVNSSSPAFDWILTLPLYWLIVRKSNDHMELISLRKTKKFLFKKSMLPNADKVSWYDIVKDCDTADHQRHLLKLSKPILQYAENFPWIVDTFLYFVSRPTLMNILKNAAEYELSSYFALDSVLYMLCKRGIAPYDKSKALLEAIPTEQYFRKRYAEISQGNIRCTLGGAEGILQSSKNVIDLLSTTADSISWHSTDGSKMILFIMRIANWAAEQIFLSTKHEDDVTVTSLYNLLTKVSQAISGWSTFHLRELQLINDLLALRWSHSQFANDCGTVIIDELKRNLKKSWSNKKKEFFQTYIESWREMDFEQCLDECLEQYALGCVESLLQDQHWSGWWRPSGRDWWRPSGRDFLMKVIIQQYNKICNMPVVKQSRPVMHCVHFITTWPFAPRIFQALSNDEDLVGSNNSDAGNVRRIIIDFRQAMGCFHSGVLTVSETRYILQNERSVSEFYSAIKEGTSHGSNVDTNLSRQMKDTRETLRSIESFNSCVKTFLSFCDSIANDSVIIDASELKEHPVLKDMKLKEIVQYQNGKPIGIMEDEILSKDDIAELELLDLMSRGIIFGQTWEEAVQQFCNEISEHQLQQDHSWRVVLEHIWTETVKNQLITLADDIFSGSVKVSDLHELFSAEHDKKQIHAELHILSQITSESEASDELPLRVNQIYHYFRLLTGAKIAKNIRSLKRKLGLTGNFASVDKRVRSDGAAPLQSITIPEDDDDTDEIWTNTELSEILQKFVSQSKLVQWVIKNMKDLGEVKTFCDLGMISAGESKIEVDKISCFLKAVTGFAPLIYLQKSSGIREVVAAVSAVKNNCDADDTLLEKWHDTGTHLNRLIEIGQLHGSEGAQSLALAKSINKSGIYSICKPSDGVPTVDTCLALSLKTGKEEKKCTYADLKDLQSKLMLIAGDAEQGQNDVAKFNDVMNSVTSLADVYVKLLNSGCMLFNTWSATIMCGCDGFTIALRFHENVGPLSMPSTQHDLEQLIAALNEALTSWITYINEMRLKHYHLNDYCIMQISYLCEKLAKSDFTDQVFCLLSHRPKEDLENQLQDIIEEATEVVENDDVGDVQDNNNDDEEETKLDAKKRIVRALVKQGNDEDVAKAAAQCEENNLDITDCELWILDHLHDSELVAELVEEFDKDSGFGHDSSVSDRPVSLLHNRTHSTLMELISHIQSIVNSDRDVGIGSIVRGICKSYNDKTSRLTLKDFLSIDHLGNFLGILRSRLAGKNRGIQRDMRAPMERGKANLILTPTQDMLLATVALYMKNKDEPLPSTSEVLVCTEKTTTDAAGRFLRRAMCKNPIKEKRLYVMTCADQLTFTVSEYIEKLYIDLSSSDCLDRDYQLIILSSSAQPQHYLVTCFERSRVEAKIPFSLSDLSTYVCEKLKAKPSAIPANHVASAKLVLSNRSGVGKSLHIQRLIETMDETTNVTILRLLEREIDVDHMLKSLYNKSQTQNEHPHLIHIDLTSAVQQGLEEFAFNLFILRSVQDSRGQIWRHHCQHFYAVEMDKSKMLQEHSVLNLLPRTECLAPKEVLARYRENAKEIASTDYILMDDGEFFSDVFQRPFQYLQRYANNSNLDKFTYTHPQDNKKECLEVLLQHCGMMNPTWAQLKYFTTFLNIQLVNCEESIFCKEIEGAGRNDTIEFPGLKAFAVYFMIRMAQDFTTPSLKISDESTKDTADALENHTIRRKWEDQTHPFVFFNEDGCTMTFINVNVNNNGDLLNSDGTIAKNNMVSRFLLDALKRQKVPIGISFDSLNRDEKLLVLCQFMNIPQRFDPDTTYELTTDNVLKMLALYMRLRCQIPVIVMGETGCGKTRMVEFMSKLKQGPHKTQPTNMVTLKVHGGISSVDIYANVEKAILRAKENVKNGIENSTNLTTTLFFDEANTTRAIYAIKEAVCDMTIDGKDFKDSHLQIVAACNPYKKLSEMAVKKLEESGLGYNMKASETEHLGGVPMRRLVYRVVALPPSLQPFVWDFGQLGRNAEEIYIRQMTSHLVKKLKLGESDADLMNLILFHSQCHMRKKCEDECRYVSLRDVERCLKAFEWFYKHKDHIFPRITDYHKERKRQHPDHYKLVQLPDTLRCLIHTVGICYHASLDDRESFRKQLSEVLQDQGVEVVLTASQINLEIIACQAVFADNLKMEDDIACNEALRENVFLMTVCADLRIPLFLVGKPGSSKSLAKTILGDNMQGNSSHSELYKNFKEVHIVSYQCSAHTDAAGIETIFNQCSQLQANQNIESYAAVVVLDEIGLAEDSPNMPLKVLHPLLESGSTENGTLTEFDIKKKVAFIGISNWALDPAKMNRGIFVTRGKPDKKDLSDTAKIIFQNRKNQHGSTIQSLTKAYMKVYKNQTREYFGLRDYYSLIKMLQASSRDGSLDKDAIKQAIQRNFSGKDGSEINVFYGALKYLTPAVSIPVQDMVRENLMDDRSRFLLLLANQYSSFSLLQNFIPDFNKKVQVIFGSSFPNDHSYTEMCRNINRVKVCMEQGSTVILLNLTDINESLYDALNQHYVTFGGERYVDVALGGHRVKCKVAKGFRLIVIELKEKVYREYPIPLINRLEKHHLTSESLLSDEQRALSDVINEWINTFSRISGSQFTVPDALLGHNKDSVSSVIISNPKEDEEHIKHVLLQSATMDAVFRLPKSRLGGEGNSLLNVYVNEQYHGNLSDFLLNSSKNDNGHPPTLFEITTFSHILSDADRRDLENKLGTGKNTVMLLSLPQFQTEQEYLKKLDDFFDFCGKRNENNERPVSVLLVQCPQAHRYVQLIACARYGLKNKLSHTEFRNRVVVAMLLSTERGLKKSQQSAEEKVLSLQHNSDCQIIYIDELRSTDRSIRKTQQLHKNSITDILQNGLDCFNMTEGVEEIINLSTLIKDCVCEAMTKVKNTAKDSRRDLERVQLLSDICSSDIGNDFVRILTKKMIEILTQRDNDAVVSLGNWVENEACSPERLQEGGTFSKTIWLCLRRHVSLIMAYIVSIIDREDNLDLVIKNYDVNGPIHRIWLSLFSEYKFSWRHARRSNEFTISVKKQLNVSDANVRMPFGFFIRETFAKIWDSADTLDFNMRLNVCGRVFENSYKKICMTLSSDIFQSSDYLVAFATEVLLTELYTHPDSTQHLAQFVVNMARDMSRSGKSAANMFLLMYMVIKIYDREIKLLDAAIQLHEQCGNIIDGWTRNSSSEGNNEAYHDVISHLLFEGNKMALEIKDPASCAEWMDFINKLQPIFYCAIDLDEIQYKETLMKRWEPIAILDMLLVHLLPDPSQEERFKRYIGVISTQAKLLFKGASRSAVNGQQFLRIVCNILRKYLEDIRLKIIIQWGNKMCRICRKDCNLPIVLACGHYFCRNCLEKHLLALQGPKKCFLCSLSLPDDFSPEPTELTVEQMLEVTEFKCSCTSLFLEYLSQFVFRKEEEDGYLKPQDGSACLINLIFEELIVPRRNEEKKPELEIFGLDLNRATCSSMVGILCKSNQIKTEEVIDSILNTDNIKEAFASVLLHYERMNKEQDYIDVERCLQDSTEQLKKFIQYTNDNEVHMTAEYIASLAAARCALVNFVRVITDKSIDKQDDALQALLDSLAYDIKSIAERGKDESLIDFIVKVGCRMYGLSWFSETMMQDRWSKALIPKKLRQGQLPSTLDIFTSLGPVYHQLRSKLRKTPFEDHEEALGGWLEGCNDSPLDANTLIKLLTITTWLSENRSCLGIYKTRFDGMPQHVKGTFDSMSDVVENLWPLVLRSAKGSEQHLCTIKQLVLLICSVIQQETPLMSNLKLLMLDPSQLQEKFWPAMPESFYFSIPQSLRTENGMDAMYICPNGHIYTIGQCTRPWTVSKCPDCGAAIGGVCHNAAEGNQRIQLDEKSQVGYMINKDEKNLQQPEDRISLQASSVIQLLIHMCMLCGFHKNPASAIRILGSQEEFAPYLMKAIDKNVTDFAKAIGRNRDEGILIIFNIVIELMKDPTTKQLPKKLANWDTLQSRKDWENQFREVYLLPVFQNLDQILQDAHRNLNTAEDMTAINLFRLVYEIDITDQCDNTFPLWDYYQHPSVQHLMQCIRDGTSLQKGSILRVILETSQIEDLNYLEAVINLQHAMVAKLQNKIDLEDSETKKIEHYINKDPSLKEMLVKYMEAWNGMRRKLQENPETDKNMQLWFDEDLRLSSPISCLLPSDRGRGKCAKLLAKHLTAKHNEFLQRCFEIASLNASERETEASLLTTSHFLKINIKTDLLSMIYLHTFHHMMESSHGRRQHITYNLDALEKQARKEFLSNAKFILPETLPSIKYPQDIGIGSDWGKVRKKIIKQEPLPARLIQSANERINNATSAEVCEGVRTLTYAISFLAKVECDPDRQILDYLENVLLLPKTRTAVIPRIAKICHVLALYQHLTWRKAVGFVQQGLHPYKEALSRMNEERIEDEGVKSRISIAFQHMNVELFQQRVNEMLIQIPDFDENWSLVDDIFPFLDLLFTSDEEEEGAWYDKLPSDITFKQVSHLFELSVNHEQSRNF